MSQTRSSIKKKHIEKSNRETIAPMTLSYNVGYMFVDKQKSLKNGLRIFSDAVKGKAGSKKLNK